MRIAIDVSQAQYQGMGVGRYTKELVHHLYDCTVGDELVLVAGALSQRLTLRNLFSPLPSHVTWKWLPLSPKLADLVFNRTELPLEALIGRVDVVHTSDWTQPKTLAPSVTTVHDLTVFSYSEAHHPYVVATQKRRMTRVLKSAHHIITDAVSTIDDLRSEFPDLTQPISAIPLAASPEFEDFSILERQARSRQIKATMNEFGLSEYVLTVGTLEPRKNLARTIAAFSQIAKTQPHLDLVVVGKIGWGPQVESVIPSTIKSRVKLLGFVDNSHLPALYRAAKCLVYPSLYEGFGLPVLEAMTVGCPVVTSSSGSLAEVGGNAVVRVNPLSVGSIARGIETAMIEHKQLRAKGEAHVRDYSWKKTAEATYQIYQQVATSSSRR